ncbi:hypothetical protein P6709_19945 [Jeotgalibacillus sp. ET6]|uniref:hypothetical protein n=1 Tax=Jeotgalibacillus sp. ET6 TaxID=3037260 RepID=UPI0024189CC2|nr:hypothetical protein [Jeotgalibacillus sp. ET6]MDG5473981.1 hypothetical protein [Jeotgalibacillus sp. ET6]
MRMIRCGVNRLGVFAFTDDGVGVQNADMMLEAMKKARYDETTDERILRTGVFFA